MLKLVRIAALLGAMSPALLPGQYYPRRIYTPGTPKPGSYSVTGSFHGKLKDLTGKEITIETDDDQVLTLHRSHKTKFFKGTESIKPSDIDLETPVTVDAKEEVDLSLTAVAVTVDTPKKKDQSNQ